VSELRSHRHLPVGREQDFDGSEVVGDERLPRNGVDVGSDPEPLEMALRPRPVISEGPLDIGLVSDIEIAKTDAQYALAVAGERAALTGCVQGQEPLRPVRPKKVVDQNRALGVCRPVVPVVPFGPG
jgi:hypothetical protein